MSPWVLIVHIVKKKYITWTDIAKSKTNNKIRAFLQYFHPALAGVTIVFKRPGQDSYYYSSIHLLLHSSHPSC